MCHGARARVAARRNPVAQGNTKVIYPVIHAGFKNWLGTVFFSDSAFICVLYRRGVVTSEHSWSENITVLQANAGLCTEEREGCWSWLCISLLRVTVAAKYTLTTTTGRGWIATIMWWLCMSTRLITPQPRTEPNGSLVQTERRTSSRLGQWVTRGQAPAADFSWKPTLAFPHVCWWCNCFHVCWLSTFSHGLWVKRVLPACQSSLWECPGHGRCAGESKVCVPGCLNCARNPKSVPCL